MDHFERLSRRHNFISKLSAAFFYALAVAVALNFFWHPGKIYASGVTGFSQVLESLSSRYLPFTLTTSSMYFVLNIPLFILGWLKIGKKFTLFTIIAVILASIMMKLIAPIKLSYDPIICAIFGGVVNGVGTGIALKSGISTGGIDVLGIILRRKTGKSFGQINIFFNLIIVICAGFVFGWTRALYTALNIFINGRVIDAVYTQHQKMQVIIVTEHPTEIVEQIQEKMHRGITILHDAEGAYSHNEKTVL
ncbi:MAG: YitT family protein, partial [Lactobacillus iners]|nr:YitT family protein [Lactobacillus iners]